MSRALALIVALLLMVTACTGDARESTGDTPGAGGAATTEPTGGGADGAEQAPRPPHPVSLPAMMAREFRGGRLRLGAEVLRTSSHRQHEVTYRSGDLTISGRIAIPHGRGPFPAVVLAHGYIDPAVYVNGQGMTREREWFGSNGFIALHVDYRNHAASDTDPRADVELRLGYTADVINAVHALRGWRGPVDDERVAVGGRSMGGGVVYNVLTVAPGLVDAGVVWAPVSSNTVDNFEQWIRPDSGRDQLAQQIVRRYGDPRRRSSRAFWRAVSPRTYFDRVTEPVLIHHGTLDDSCPIRWSRATHRALRGSGVDVTYREYPGEGHAFGPRFFDSMELTGRFLRRYLR